MTWLQILAAPALFQRKRVWGQEGMWNEGQHLKEISGATLGLIGVGSIGRRVAQMASALGMRVIAVREHIEKGRPEGVEAVFSPVQLGELLGQSDYVVVAAPLLASTTRLMDATRLAMMKTLAAMPSRRQPIHLLKPRFNAGSSPCIHPPGGGQDRPGQTLAGRARSRPEGGIDR